MIRKEWYEQPRANEQYISSKQIEYSLYIFIKTTSQIINSKSCISYT